MAEIARIGRVPREPVIELEGVGSPPAVAGIDFVQADWGYSLWECFRDYVHEQMIAHNSAHIRIRRQCYVFMSICDFFGAHLPITKIERAFGRGYTEHNAKLGNGPATARHHLTLLVAWINHAKREGHSKHEVKMWKPEAPPPRVEVLTHEQERALFAVPKIRRLQLFLYIVFNTGARSEAIEELEWSRVDFVNRTIDFRVPGVRYRNKRRVIVPMNDALHRRLLAAKQYADANLPDVAEVIGLGVKGRRSSTYHGIAACYKAINLKVKAPRHIARHTVATRLLQQKTPISEVAALLGDRVAMIEKVYAHYIPSDLMHAANRLH